MKENYYFYYKINRDDLDIIIFDDSITYNLKNILHDPNLYSILPSVSIDTLFYGINKLRIKCKEEQYHNVKRILDFVEELFAYEYTKMDNMIKDNIIDYHSLWYYYDKIDMIYKIESLDNDICIKYINFKYDHDKKHFKLYGKVLYPYKNTIYNCELILVITRYPFLKKINHLDIKIVDDVDIKKFAEYGNKILQLYKNIKHMLLIGNQYYAKDNDVVIVDKYEKVIVDNDGFEKYSNFSFIFTPDNCTDINIKKIKSNDRDLAIIYPFIGIYNLDLNKRWGLAHINNLQKIKYKIKI